MTWGYPKMRNQSFSWLASVEVWMICLMISKNNCIRCLAIKTHLLLLLMNNITWGRRKLLIIFYSSLSVIWKKMVFLLNNKSASKRKVWPKLMRFWVKNLHSTSARLIHWSKIMSSASNRLSRLFKSWPIICDLDKWMGFWGFGVQ